MRSFLPEELNTQPCYCKMRDHCWLGLELLYHCCIEDPLVVCPPVSRHLPVVRLTTLEYPLPADTSVQRWLVLEPKAHC